MSIDEFISQYRNHPVLFIGSGLSFRYLENTYTWDALLSKVCLDLWGSDETYLDIKSSCTKPNGYCPFDEVATKIEEKFNVALENDRNGKFKSVNDVFYDNMRNGVSLSRFKIYIAKLLKNGRERKDKIDEINELKKTRKNIGSIITTNYDTFLEELFGFKPLVGNNILLSNPYGSIYKIHGCIKNLF